MLKRNLPNFITLANLASGCVGLQLVLSGKPEWAPWCILLSAVFDFFDGTAARLLNAHSAIGKDLDSLADVVSFGVLPGFIINNLIEQALSEQSSYTGEEPVMAFFRFVFILTPLLSAWRLAKFNNDPEQTDSFKGLPTPANGLLWAGLAYGLYQDEFALVNNPWILAILSILLAGMLIANMPMFSLKIKSLTWKGNRLRVLFILAAVPLLLCLGIAGLFPVILLYICLSAIRLLFFKPDAG